MIITPLVGLCYVGLVGAGGCSCAYAHGTLIAWIIGRASRMRPLLLSETTPLLQIAQPAFQLAIAARACGCRGLGLVRGAVQLHAEAVQLYSHLSRPRFMQIVQEARQNALLYTSLCTVVCPENNSCFHEALCATREIRKLQHSARAQSRVSSHRARSHGQSLVSQQ